MTVRERSLLAACIVLLLVAVVWYWSSSPRHLTTSTAIATPTKQLFAQSELKAFLAAAKKAEAIPDPLQRCLQYPNPPGSHWSLVAIKAYCDYRYQTVVPFSRVRELVQHGDAKQLDRLFADALRKQRTQPEARGLLDRTYRHDFDTGALDVRAIVDAWKRQSPDSAFAYAASGWSYAAMALDARGTAFANETSQSQFDSMNRLLIQATGDLDHAVQLDPQLTSAYVAMITAGGLGSDSRYALNAGQRGLSVDPANYSIYLSLLWLAQPKWGGSIEAMQTVAKTAQQQAKANLLLLLLRPLPAATKANLENCSCGPPMRLDQVRRVLDKPVPNRWLDPIGRELYRADQRAAAVIYLSEVLRFNPLMSGDMGRRSADLADLGYPAWALEEANRAVTMAHNAFALGNRAYVYKVTHNYQGEIQDLRAALKLDPDDAWSLTQLGEVYVHQTHQWDEAWATANRLIQMHPKDPNGWILRAHVQMDQPRPGLRDTITYFLQHFGNDPSERSAVAKMRETLAKLP